MGARCCGAAPLTGLVRAAQVQIGLGGCRHARRDPCGACCRSDLARLTGADCKARCGHCVTAPPKLACALLSACKGHAPPRSRCQQGFGVGGGLAVRGGQRGRRGPRGARRGAHPRRAAAGCRPERPAGARGGRGAAGGALRHVPAASPAAGRAGRGAAAAEVQGGLRHGRCVGQALPPILRRPV